MGAKKKHWERFTGDPKTTTLEEAADWLDARIEKGAECPCCTQEAKVYKWGLISRMGKMLIELWRATKNDPSKYVHINDLIRVSPNPDIYRSGATVMSERWGLIEEAPPDPLNANPHQGYWRLTQKGLNFIMRGIRVPRYLRVYNGKVLEFGEETISLREVLKKDFDYLEMMGVALPLCRSTT